MHSLTASHLDSPDIQRIRINLRVNIAPLIRLEVSVLFGEPLAVAFGLDPRLVNQEMPCAGASAIWEWSCRALVPPQVLV